MSLDAMGCQKKITIASLSEEDRYWFTSLAPDVQKLLGLSCGHWGIENQSHWVMEVSMARTPRAFAAATPLATSPCCGLAHNQLNHDQTVNFSIAGKPKRASLSTATLEKLLEFSVQNGVTLVTIVF